MRPPGVASENAASVAAEPEPKAKASVPPSSAAIARSSESRFGLLVRE